MTMASPTSDVVFSPTDRPIPGRSDSLTSNASSLARRPCIRGRTRTPPEGSRWSDSTGGPQSLAGTRRVNRDIGAACESQVTEEQLVAEPVQFPPPRPPRSSRRSGMLVEENGELEVPPTVLRDRKHSTTSTRSAKSNRGQNVSLQELIDLKNVRDIPVECYIYSDLSTFRPLQANGELVCHVCGQHKLRINLRYPLLTLRAVFMAIVTLYRPENRHPPHYILCPHTRSLLLNHLYLHTL